jgi:Dual specificity phosphatase, catalytic domain
VNEVKAFRTIRQGNTMVLLHHQPVPISVEVAGRHDPFKVGFQLAIKKINNIFFNDPEAKILIHCTAGIDRSPFLAASSLAKSRHLPISDIYREIKKVRPSVIEHLEWVW